jgi:hypothetical protein
MSTRLTDRPSGDAIAEREPLDPELERRVAALESPGTDAGSDFDAASWFWMLLLGVVGPVILLLWGWFGR